MTRDGRLSIYLLALLAASLAAALTAAGREAISARSATGARSETSPINNRNYVESEMARPRVEQAWPFLGGGSDWTYSHHPHITFFKGRFHVIFSNGHEKEDRSGQRVMLSTSRDFKTWTTPVPIAEPPLGPDGNPVVFTPAGFHQYKGRLVVYIGQYEESKANTKLRYITTTDGKRWTPIKDLGPLMIPNHGPHKTSTGRLIIPSNISFAYTDDPAGLSGWKTTGIYPKTMANFADNPDTFKEVGRRVGWGALVCEGAFYETDDRVLHMGLRAVQGPKPEKLWMTESRDDGRTWSEPFMLDGFSNSSAKFHFGRLPDRRFYFIGSPVRRNPLILSLSEDGINFSEHFLLLKEDTEKKATGDDRNGSVAWAYPHSLIHGGYLYTVASANKRAIVVTRVALADLAKPEGR